MFFKNRAGQVFQTQMVTASDGSAFTGAVTVYIEGDNGTQTVGSVGSGVCTHKGNGSFSYLPSQAETNFDCIKLTFIGTGAVPAGQTIYPTDLAVYGIQAVGTLDGSHSTTTADLGSNGPTHPDTVGMTLVFPTRGISRIIDAYDTGTRVATFREISSNILTNGDPWEILMSPLGSTTLMPVKVDEISPDVINASALASSAVSKMFNSQLSISYPTPGDPASPGQVLMWLMQMMSNASVAGTTMTVYGLDGTTVIGTLTLNDAGTPTAISRNT